MGRLLRHRRAQLAWRVKNGKNSLPAKTTAVLPDGSTLVRLRESDGVLARRRRKAGDPALARLPDVIARLVEFDLLVTDAAGKTQTSRYRVLTTLVDHQAYPAGGFMPTYYGSLGLVVESPFGVPGAAGSLATRMPSRSTRAKSSATRSVTTPRGLRMTQAHKYRASGGTNIVCSVAASPDALGPVSVQASIRAVSGLDGCNSPGAGAPPAAVGRILRSS
jgi:hypothetical protein